MQLTDRFPLLGPPQQGGYYPQVRSNVAEIEMRLQCAQSLSQPHSNPSRPTTVAHPLRATLNRAIRSRVVTHSRDIHNNPLRRSTCECALLSGRLRLLVSLGHTGEDHATGDGPGL